MRKRSNYKPRGLIVDTMAWLKQGMQKVTALSDADATMRLQYEMSLDAVITNTATTRDLNILVSTANMTTALARKHGADWREEIRAGVDAIEAMQHRLSRWKKVQATAPELEAIKLLMRIHNAQLDAARVADIEAALVIAERGAQSVKEIAV